MGFMPRLYLATLYPIISHTGDAVRRKSTWFIWAWLSFDFFVPAVTGPTLSPRPNAMFPIATGYMVLGFLGLFAEGYFERATKRFSSKTRTKLFGSIVEEAFLDLLRAPLSFEDFAAGLWAAKANHPFGRNFLRFFTAIGFAALAYILIFGRLFSGFMATLVLAYCVWCVVLANAYPIQVLRELRRSALQIRWAFRREFEIVEDPRRGGWIGLAVIAIALSSLLVILIPIYVYAALFTSITALIALFVRSRLNRNPVELYRSFLKEFAPVLARVREEQRDSEESETMETSSSTPIRAEAS